MVCAYLLVESSHSSSVLELLQVVLSSGTAVLAVGGDHDSALVGGRGQVYLQDLGADRTRKLQERERCTRLDDNGLETIVKHVRGHQLKLLRGNQLDGLAVARGRDLPSQSVTLIERARKAKTEEEERDEEVTDLCA
jgi:hypothetical protein